jgi:hypothetical protein
VSVSGVFYTLLGGALLGLASLLIPWGQLLGLQIFLPLSLPLVFAESLTSSTPISVTTSLAAHLATVLAWSSFAAYIYTKKRLIPQLIAVASGVLALSSAILFIQTGWALSWGWVMVIIAGIFAIAAGALLQTRRTSLKDSQSEPDSSTK